MNAFEKITAGLDGIRPWPQELVDELHAQVISVIGPFLRDHAFEFALTNRLDNATAVAHRLAGQFLVDAGGTLIDTAELLERATGTAPDEDGPRSQ